VLQVKAYQLSLSPAKTYMTPAVYCGSKMTPASITALTFVYFHQLSQFLADKMQEICPPTAQLGPMLTDKGKLICQNVQNSKPYCDKIPVLRNIPSDCAIQ